MNGPNSLGTLLIQRLDAVLGTPLASHGDLQSGLRADAVRQPGAPVKVEPTEGEPRQDGERAALKQAAGQADQGAVKDAKLATLLALNARGRVVQQSATSSAPTSLGQGARAILALLAAFPDAPAVVGRQPLLQTALGSFSNPLSDGAAAQGNPAQASDAARGAQSMATPGAGAPDHARAAAGGRTAPAGDSAARPGQGAEAARGASALAGATDTGAPSVRALAQALHQAIDKSGLFYESHLSDMAFGKRAAPDLRHEPQNQSTAAQPQTGGSSTAQPPAAPRDAGIASFFGAALADAADAPAPRMTGAAQGQDIAPTTQHGVRTDTAAIVRQQLDILTNQAIVWQGEAWTGTPMQWEIERRQAAQAASPDAPPSWATKIAVTLPRLGRVEATLNLVGNDIVMRLVAPESEPDIRASSAVLRSQFQAAGLTLSHLVIDEDAARAHDVDEQNGPAT
ncbi:flagellar hook-length control protein FliK [Alcaligenaceae bacterium B3P038]|nr:flagellar hook-length control protein FliK [Alcaligenaceae bacterium B3P038]